MSRLRSSSLPQTMQGGVSTPRRRYRWVRRGALAAALLAPTTIAQVPQAAAADAVTGAVVLMYHRFGEDNIPSTNIRIEQFEKHIAELRSGNYNVVPLADIVEAFARRRPLAPNTVALTIDDAVASIYDEAWPRLRAAGLPFTVFVATDPVDRGLPGYMSWGQIRQLIEAGATVANHTASHLHMVTADDEANREEMRRAQQRILEETGTAPTLFAYPYGEYSDRTIELVKDAGFAAAFGQHSGVSHALASLYELPRFALNETYGEIGRFRLVVNTLPLPVHEVTPADTLLDRNNPPPFGFTVNRRIDGLDRLNCFASNGPTTIERLGANRFEVRIAKPFPRGRGRFNCTLPTRDGRFRWFGIQFVVP